jgi:hypothetical protein
MLKKLFLLLLLLFLVFLILLLLDYCSSGSGDPDPTPSPANHAPSARNDDLAGCSLTLAGGAVSCTFVAAPGTLFADNGSGIDSDADGDPFTAASTGTIVVGGTGDLWSPPGPEPRRCNAEFLCTSDRNFDGAASHLTIRPDGGFTLVYVTGFEPVGMLIAEFLYQLTDSHGLSSDPAYVQVFLSP